MAFLIDQGGGGPVSPSVRKATAMNFVIDVGQTTIKFKNYKLFIIMFIIIYILCI